MKSKEHNRRIKGAKLTLFAAGLFTLALMLPAAKGMGWMSGFDCLKFVLGAWVDLPKISGWADGYLLGFGITNLILLVGLPLAAKKRGDRRWLRRLSKAVGAACAYNATLPFSGLVDAKDLSIGYLLWVISFAMATAGLKLLGTPVSRNTTSLTSNTRQTIEEEIRARRELEDYLHGIQRGEQEETLENIQVSGNNRTIGLREGLAHAVQSKFAVQP